MRKPFLLLLFWWLATAATFAQQKKDKGTTEEAILQAEKQRFASMIKKDMNGLREILADDLVYTHSNGLTENKEQYLQGLASGKSVYYAIQPEETKVRLYGNIAFVNGIAKVDTESNGQKTTMRLKYTDAYVKRNGKWQMITWQSLRMQE